MNPITQQIEKLLNEGNNFSERRKQFYQSGTRCERCGKGDVDCVCPKLDRRKVTAVDPATTTKNGGGGKGKPKKNTDISDIP
jgi:hypothetical protein